MAVKQKFKQTEAGVIPLDWRVEPVGDAYEICNSLRLPISRDIRARMFGPYPYYGPTSIQGWINEYRLDGTFALIGEDGDHFLKWDRQPMTQLVTGKFNVNNHAHVIKGTRNSTEWFAIWFSNRDLSGYLTRQGAGRYKLTKAALQIIPMVLPADVLEQEAITGVLSAADVWIESLVQLIAKKRQIKQGAMQELLTGKRRLPGFTGEWDRFRFDQLFSSLRNASNSRSELSVEGEVAYVHYGDIHTHPSPFLNPIELHTCIPRAKVRTVPRLQDGDLLLADASEDTSAIGKAVEIVDLEGRQAVAGLHTMAFRGNKDRVADGFKGYLQFLPEVRSGLVSLATGVSVFGITKTGVKAIEIRIPKPNEQIAIAETLSSMDDEIRSIEFQLAKARQIKQAMMQELLTGRIRLVEPATVTADTQEAHHA